MKLLQRTLAAFAVLLMTPVVNAANQPFYFVAKSGLSNSFSEAGNGEPVVYLRWDAVEGNLPADLTGFRLLRDGQQVAEFPAGTAVLMPPQEIAKLYQGPAQERRLLETLTALKQLEVGINQADDAAGTAIPVFDASDFPPVLHSQLQSSAFWRSLGARSDFNIARAQYRAYLDQPGTGQFEYELLAISRSGASVRAGLLRVDTSAPQNVLPANRFRQITMGECDRPEDWLNHYTVALGWDVPGGANLADRLASNVFIAGYDLYRSKENLPIKVIQAPARDLAAEAAGLMHDALGRVPFTDLEKVNDTLLTLDGSDDDTPAFLENQAELASAGLKPGDRRAYYLVPRDFTGNYGPTVATVVQIPDLIRPEAPWDVLVIADDAASPPRLEMTFSAVNYDNYAAEFLGQRQICNPAEAIDNGRVSTVGPNEDCAVDTRFTTRVDATSYRIYRFDNFQAAKNFADSDGDGADDVAERNSGIPGAACDASQVAGTNRLVPNASIGLTSRTLADGKQIIAFRDAAPVVNSNDDVVESSSVYWYRIAAVADDGRASLMSAPKRAFYPDRSRPEPPAVTVETIDPESCKCTQLSVTDANADWQFVDQFGVRSSITLTCGVGAANPREIRVRPDDIANSNSAFCRDGVLPDICQSGQVDYRYGADTKFVGKLSDQECSGSIPAGASLCQQGAVELNPVSCNNRQPLATGQSATGDVIVTVGAVPGSCVSLFRTIAGRNVRVSSNCGEDNPGSLEYRHRNGNFCGYALAQNANSQQSPLARIPCVRSEVADTTQLTPPQPVSLDFLSDNANMAWRLPAERIAATVIELQRESDGETLLLSAPSEVSDSKPVQTLSEQLPSALAVGERWCMRLQALAPSLANQPGNRSRWTSPLCAARDGSALPQYLPWPEQPLAPEGEAIVAQVPTTAFNGLADGLYIRLPIAEVEGVESFCAIERQTVVLGSALERLYLQPVCSLGKGLPGRRRIESALANQLGVMLYRQRRRADGSLADWQQVSPRLDTVFFKRLTVTGNDGNTATNFQLSDPFIGLYDLDRSSGKMGLALLDRFPYQPGSEYRYQLVKFSADNRILSWRSSNWITTRSTLNGAPATSASSPNSGATLLNPILTPSTGLVIDSNVQLLIDNTVPAVNLTTLPEGNQ